jgi:oligo-1,6-glucosidase
MGFRCDVINVIYKNSLENGRPSPILTGMEHYLSTEGCHEILRELRKVLDEYGAFTVGETVFVDIPKAKDLTDPERKELDMVFAFQHMEVDQVIVKWFKTWLDPHKLMKCLTKWQQGINWNAIYFENHDQPRFISRFCDSKGHREKASTMMAGLQMTLRGTPYVFEGQEIGMTNADFENLSQVEDIESHNIYAMAKKLGIPAALRWKMILRTSRDHGRTPMQWDATANAGFTTGKPWLKVNGNYKRVNVAKEMENEQGVRAFWKYMIGLRKSEPALIDGEFVPVHMGKTIFAFERYTDDKRLLVLCNFCGKEKKLPKHLTDWKQLVACNYNTVSFDTMRPFEFRLLEESR